MNRLTKQIVNTAILALMLSIAGLLVKDLHPGLIDGISLVVLIPSFFITSVISLIIFNAGSSKPPDTQPLFSLASVGTKFFLDATNALVFFAILKKSGSSFVLLFFIVYLAFTVHLIREILKALKNRSLKL